MIKYKRRTINQKAHLHDEEFVTVNDALEALNKLVNCAIAAGADKDKLEELMCEKDS